MMTKTKTISPYADPGVVVRRGVPIISFPCPGCRRPCDFRMSHRGEAVYSIDCPDCGTVRVVPGLEGRDVVMAIEGTGLRYDDQAELNAAKAGLEAVRGNAPEECLAMAEVAWETYLFLTFDAPMMWKAAVEVFRRCKDIDKAHARRMVPWILRFCEIGGTGEMRSIDRYACAKAVCVIGKPEAAAECMLWMEYFYLECRQGMINEYETSIPDIAKAAYLALSESEQAECPAFPVLWPLIMYSCSSDYREEGGIDCSDEELADFETAMWSEAVSEAERMLSAGHPMTSRIFRMLCANGALEMLPPAVSPVCGQLRRLGELSGEYGDAFRAEADLLEVLMSVRGTSVMPCSPKSRLDWTPEAFAKLEGAIRMLERYPDPAIVGDILIDAYYLLYTHEGAPEALEYCQQLEEETVNRLIEVGAKHYMGNSPSSLMEDLGCPFGWDDEPTSKRRA